MAGPPASSPMADGIGRGSGRSVAGLALGPAVIAARQAGLLVNGGGHAMRAGFTVEAAKLLALRDFLAARIAEALGEGEPTSELAIDGALSAAAATPAIGGTHRATGGRSAPANSEPRFVFPALRIMHAEPVGGAHLRLALADGAGAGAIEGDGVPFARRRAGAGAPRRQGPRLPFGRPSPRRPLARARRRALHVDDAAPA